MNLYMSYISKEQQPFKSYWFITKLIPSPKSGSVFKIIELPERPLLIVSIFDTTDIVMYNT